MIQKTPWFSRDVDPVRKGVYEVHDMPSDTDQYFSYFDGEMWHGGWTSVERAYAYRDHPDTASRCYQGWRGLANKP